MLGAGVSAVVLYQSWLIPAGRNQLLKFSGLLVEITWVAWDRPPQSSKAINQCPPLHTHLPLWKLIKGNLTKAQWEVGRGRRTAPCQLQEELSILLPTDPKEESPAGKNGQLRALTGEDVHWIFCKKCTTQKLSQWEITITLAFLRWTSIQNNGSQFPPFSP